MHISIEAVFYAVTLFVMAFGWLKSAMIGWLKLSKILEEVKPNSGHSMNDRLVRCEKGVVECQAANAHEKKELAELRREMGEQTMMLNKLIGASEEVNRRDHLG